MNLLQLCFLFVFCVLTEAQHSKSDVIGSPYSNNVVPRVSSDGSPTKSMADYVFPRGYPLEHYKVVTEDGYILGIYRIPHGRNNTSANRPPIILQHGIFASSACFVMGDPALAFVLADAGYDVWLSNARGNTYSTMHTKLDPVKDSEEFYNFSFHELGYYDLPAVIDFVLSKTQNTHLSYIGHSQGTTEFFVLTSERPEYNAKIRVAAAMAPVVFMSDIQGSFKFLSHFTEILNILNRFFSIHVVFKNWNVPSVNSFPISMIVPRMIDQLLSSICGYDSILFNKSILPAMIIQGSSGASIKQLQHYAQIIESDAKFSKFDYGKQENMVKYNQTEPPEYDLSKITTHINLHYSDNDYLSRPKDVKHVYSKLQHSTLIEVPAPTFNHIDFLWANNVNELLFDNLIKLLKI